MPSPCYGTPGQDVCFNSVAPIGVSDGGGPQDQTRNAMVSRRIEIMIKSQEPPVYHPLILPENRGVLQLDPETESILNTVFALINSSNPSLAQNCWLCLKNGPLLAQAILVNNISLSLLPSSCQLLPPRPNIYISPLSPNTSCLWAPPLADNSSNLDLGRIDDVFCSNNCRKGRHLLVFAGGMLLLCQQIGHSSR